VEAQSLAVAHGPGDISIDKWLQPA